MSDPLVFAIGSVAVGLISGMVGAGLVHRIIKRRQRGRPEAEDFARATALLLFLFFVALGIIVAVSFVNPESLESVPVELLRASPRLLAAGLIIIVARAFAYALSGMATTMLAASTGRARRQVAALGRWTVYIVAGVLVLNQLGVETTILTILIGAGAFALAGSFALLVGFGGREVGTELAAGRSISRIIDVGDDIVVDDLQGQVLALHPTSVELLVADGDIMHVANTRFTRGDVIVRGSAEN